MTLRFRAAVMACSLGACLSCGHHVDRADRQAMDSLPGSVPSVRALPPSPNRCRILGTVLQVDTPDTLGILRSVSCLVRVDSILGYGSSFGIPLQTGITLHVRIATFASAPDPAQPVSQQTIPVLSLLKGEIERNSADDDGSGTLNYTMYESVRIK